MIGMFALKTAIDKNIPNIVIGTTPGQMRQKRYNLIEKYTGIFDVYRSMNLPFLEILDGQDRNIMKLSLLEKIKALNVKLTPFYAYYQYNEKKAQETSEKLFGWQRPPDTDSCSTNCLINTLGIAIHKKRYGVHPYVIPLAHDVRSGLMTREDALEATNVEADFDKASEIAKELGIKL